MWHELVLAGVGGRTIAEAQQNLSIVEFYSWLAYRRKRGGLNLGMRFEQGAATICSLLAQANWKKTDGTDWTAADFMPHLTDDEADPPIDHEEAMRRWT
ncbi:phage tail assembly protein T [Halomonas getboli]|uniref:phage tail assembly protein T n=1 Tax=Halomonas getboli TaxID=2935862 RepID=UPI001FFEEE9B|nr:hypothetical protein [Halomonas getboli]MCK2183503.1 hypothetical protein [Halomonas getboli]